MDFYPQSAVKRTMKMQEVILRAMAKRITWWQAAEILGISDRQMITNCNPGNNPAFGVGTAHKEAGQLMEWSRPY